MATNFNITPYYDDYDINKSYLRVLFRPGHSVQARELTQAQSILQGQVSSMAEHFFKEGAMVVPGAPAIDVKANFATIDLNTANSYSSPSDFVGRVLVGGTTGVRALVVHAESKTGTTSSDDPDTLYLKYLSGVRELSSSDYQTHVDGSNTYTTQSQALAAYDLEEGSSATFLSNEVLTTEVEENKSQFQCKIRPTAEGPIGTGSIAIIEDGIYFIQGFMTIVKSQTIVLDKYGSTPSYKVGLDIIEEIVTSNEDSSLLDNAQGTTNFNAPGADRYKVTLNLVKRELDSQDTSNFVILMEVKAGVLSTFVNETDYSVIEDTLAKRTYEESGNYTVKPFSLEVRNLLNENNNRGVKTMRQYEFSTETEAKNFAAKFLSDYTGMVDSVSGAGLAHTATISDRTNYPEQSLNEDGTKYYPGRTHDELVSALRKNLDLGLDTGIGYVQGYRIQTIGKTHVNYKRALDDVQKNNAVLPVELGNFIYVSDIMGLPAINDTVKLTNVNFRGEDIRYVSNNAEVNLADPASPAWPQLGATVGVASNPNELDVIATAKVKSVAYHTGIYTTDWDNSSWYDSTSIVSPLTDAPLIYKVYLYDIEFAPYPTDSANTGKRNYTINDARGIMSSEVIDSTNLKPAFSANVLTQYRLFDNNENIGSNIDRQLIVSLDRTTATGGGVNRPIGMIYSAPSGGTDILVKMLGFGNIDNKTFVSNERIAIQNTTRQLTTFRGKVFASQTIFETQGSNLINTNTRFVSTLRSVDEVTGNITNDTQYTLLKEYTATVQSADSGSVTITTSSINEQFDPVWTNTNYQIYVKSGINSGTLTRGVVLDTVEASDPNSPGNNIVPDFVSGSSNRELRISNLGAPLVGQEITILAPTITSVPQEKTKTLYKNLVNLPYTLLDPSDGTPLPSVPSDPVSNPFGTQDATFGQNGDAIGRKYAINSTFDGTFVDLNGVSYSLDTLKLPHSDVSKVHNVYDTCHPNNVIFQTDIFGTVKYINEMTKADFDFAYKAWSYHEATGVQNPYNLDPDVVSDAPFAAEYRAAVSAGLTGDIAQSSVNGHDFGNNVTQPAKLLDITNRFDIDLGQRPGVIKLAKLTLKPRNIICAGRPIVTYDYFGHSAGDYASVNSYGDVDRNAIPKFNNIYLTDVLDFRPAATSQIDSDAVLLYKDTVPTGIFFPVDNTTVTTDFKHYLPRKDKVVLTKHGNFEVVYGASSLTPQLPKDPDEGMVLFNLTTRPFTQSPNDVLIEKVENRRYTMRDIGKLERRINTLEYYTTLSLLEKETKDLVILDENGQDRFKNGFIVEPFTGHNIGDVFDPEYSIAVDGKKREMRPKADERNVNMALTLANKDAFEIVDRKVMLPFAGETMIVSQPKSSKYVNLNPFAVMPHKGNLVLAPSSDDWREVDRLPALEINRDNLFDNFEFLAEETGVLGTHWNSWQTTNVGEEITNVVDNERAEDQANLRWEDSVTETFDIITDQSRTGNRIDLNSSIVRDNMGDRVVNTEIKPFMRSRKIYFTGSGLKSNTRLYASFDGVDVTEFCNGMDEVTVDSLGQTAASLLNGGLQTEINANLGKIKLVGTQSGAERNVYGVEYVDTNSIRFLVRKTDVIQERGNFTGTESNAGEPMELELRSIGDSGETQTGLSFNKVGRFLNESLNTNLKTNDKGQINGFFDLPSGDNLRFRVGEKLFRLSDQPTPDSREVDTEASAMYAASGIVQQKQETFVNTRVPNFSDTALTDTRTLVDSGNTRRVVTGSGDLPPPPPPPNNDNDNGNETTNTGGGGGGLGGFLAAVAAFAFFDPVAQTFMLDSSNAPGGCFLSSIDIYFQRIPRDNVPVRCEIRNVVNGYPGQKIFASKTLTPAESITNNSDGTVTYNSQNIFISDNGTLPTKFSFPSPLYVEEGTELCFVLISDSTDYRIHVSRMGEQALDGTGTISKQPYLGVMFKSSNSQSWTPEQTEDIKFNLYRQNFDISKPAEVYFVNDPRDDNSELTQKINIGLGAIETTANSSLVKIHAPNHGLVDSTNFNAFNIVGIDGLLSTTLYGGTTDATGFRGGKINGFHTVVAYDADSFTIDMSNPKQSTSVLDTNTITTSDPAISATQFGGSNQTWVRSPGERTPLNYSVAGTNTVAATTGRFDAIYDSHRAGISSAYLLNNYKYDLICPNVTTITLPKTAVSYKMKTMSGAAVDNTQFSPGVKDILWRDFVPLENTFFETPRMIANSYSEDNFNTNSDSFGKKSLEYKVTLSSESSHLSPVIDTERLSATIISNRINDPILGSGDDELQETNAQGGNSLAKYITREIKLANPATSINVRVALSKPVDSDVDIYYKIKTSDDQDYRKLEYVEFDKPVGFNSSHTDFRDFEFDVKNLEEFISVGIKIVLKSKNSAVVPKATDLRIIALAK